MLLVVDRKNESRRTMGATQAEIDDVEEPLSDGLAHDQAQQSNNKTQISEASPGQATPTSSTLPSPLQYTPEDKDTVMRAVDDTDTVLFSEPFGNQSSRLEYQQQSPVMYEAPNDHPASSDNIPRYDPRCGFAESWMFDLYADMNDIVPQPPSNYPYSAVRASPEDPSSIQWQTIGAPPLLFAPENMIQPSQTPSIPSLVGNQTVFDASTFQTSHQSSDPFVRYQHLSPDHHNFQREAGTRTPRHLPYRPSSDNSLRSHHNSTPLPVQSGVAYNVRTHTYAPYN